MSEREQTTSPTFVSVPEERPSTETSAQDDMRDTPKDLARWPTLEGSLRQCEEVIGPAFRTADSAALAHQSNHRRLTKLAAGCGTVAVLFAIVQLAFPRLVEGHLLVALEMLAVLAAAGAEKMVAAGIGCA
jgi:hypothetical protein